MGFLRVSCLNCGCEFNISADEISSKTEYCCPQCKLKIDDRLWRKYRIAYFTMEETMDRMENPVVEVRLFRAQYYRHKEDEKK